MSRTIQISIRAGEAEQEILVAQLEELGASGFEQTDTHLQAYFPEDNFPSYEVQALLQQKETAINTLEEKNWNEEWERNFQPVVVGSFCAVRAHFHAPIPDVQHEIVITPKMSFGTGHHATTYMMMQQMEELDFNGKAVFDFGTGTGILAILAEKLGAAAVTGIDVDDWSIRNATENADQNGCEKIRLSLSAALPGESFGIILANINRNVLLEYMPGLNACLEQGGDLVLSGLLASDEAAIREACEDQSLGFVSRLDRQGWISLHFTRG